MNLTKIQAIFALIVHATVILSAALWIGRVLVAQEFRTQLEIFHAHAKPAISEMVDSKIGSAAADLVITRGPLTSRLATLEEHARTTDAQLDRIENKLDRVLDAR